MPENPLAGIPAKAAEVGLRVINELPFVVMLLLLEFAERLFGGLAGNANDGPPAANGRTVARRYRTIAESSRAASVGAAKAGARGASGGRVGTPARLAITIAGWLSITRSIAA